MKKGFMLIGLMVAMSATAAQQVSDPEEQSQVIKILNTMETDEAPAVRDTVAEPRIILVDQPVAAEPDAKENTSKYVSDYFDALGAAADDRFKTE